VHLQGQGFACAFNNFSIINMKLVQINLAVCFLLANTSSFAYETSTHEKLTQLAYVRSVLKQSNFHVDKLGFVNQPLPMYQTPPVDSARRDASGAMGIGAIYEDNMYGEVFCNHFMDPQWNSYQGRPLTPAGLLPPASTIVSSVCGPNGKYMSMDWALGRKGVLQDSNSPTGTHGYSYRDAMNAFYSALTSPNPAARILNEGLVFQTLGHIAHHIQDMAQPQHTRNDVHAHGNFLIDVVATSLINGAAGNPRYELYTAGKNDVLQNIEGMNTYRIPVFDRAEKYWITPGATTPKYVGMAEFSAHNFTSSGTPYYFELPQNVRVFTPQFSGAVLNLQGAPNFPLPNASNPDGIGAKYFEQEPTQVTSLGGKVLAGNRYYLKGTIYDGFTSNTITAQKLGVVTNLAQRVQRSVSGLDNRLITREDDAVNDVKHQVLLPRAVAFSAGMINFFFRGNITLTPPPSSASLSKIWTLTNNGSESISGFTDLLSENSAGVRSQVTTIPVSLASGQSAQYSVEVPSGTTKMIAAFKGRIGLEGNASGDRSSTEGVAVTGHVVAYQLPLPTITVSRSPAPYVAGQQGAVTWSSTNATSVSVACAPNAAQGYAENRILPSVSGSAAVNVLMQWASTSSNCLWTASSPGGNSTYAETVNTVAPPPPPVPCSGSQLYGAVTSSNAPAKKLSGFGSTAGKIKIEVYAGQSPFNLAAVPARFELKVYRSFGLEVNSGTATTNYATYDFNYNPSKEYSFTFFAPPNTTWSYPYVIFHCPS
jgi:hypothetical protein